MAIHNKSLLHPESSVKKQLHPREQLRSSRTVSHSCDAFVEWFVVGSVRRYYALTIARRSGRISGADLDPVPCQGHSAACLQSSVMNAMLWWGLRSQCFIWDLASNLEQELVLQPLLSYLPPTPTVVILRLNAFPNSWLLVPGGVTLLVKLLLVLYSIFLFPFGCANACLNRHRGLVPRLLLIRFLVSQFSW